MRRYLAAFVAVLLVAVGSAAYLTAEPRDALLTALEGR
jgi:hypothetical protein